MIKHKIVFCCALATLLVAGTNGALAITVVIPTTYHVKCVKPATSCSRKTITDYSLNWSATCGQTTITGIATCGYDNEELFPTTKNGATAASVTYLNATDYSNHVCWCRMVTPALSYWVYAGNDSSDDAFLFLDRDACRAGCAQQCSNMAAGNANVRAALFKYLQ